jgi:cholesterol transport system auxiliary component
LKIAFGAAIALWLVACSSAPPPSFDLTAATPSAQRGLRAQMRVALPTATADLDSDRILVRTGATGLSVLSDARWASRLPLLLQARLTETFQNARLLSAVGQGGAATFDYSLEADIRSFELDADAKQVSIDIAVKLISSAGGRVVAAQIFTARAAVASTQAADVTGALNAALSGVMTQIVSFVAAKI